MHTNNNNKPKTSNKTTSIAIPVNTSIGVQRVIPKVFMLLIAVLRSSRTTLLQLTAAIAGTTKTKSQGNFLLVSDLSV